jgi:hypothetical protein
MSSYAGERRKTGHDMACLQRPAVFHILSVWRLTMDDRDPLTRCGIGSAGICGYAASAATA